MSVCRCGWDGTGDHPCHSKGYTCRKPASQRFYNPHPVALSGQQFKLEVTETFACDACWAEFSAMMERVRDGEADVGAGCVVSQDDVIERLRARTHATVCTCDRDEMERVERSIVDRVGPYMQDADGNRLYYVDSFGFRSRIPGECDSCYEEYKREYERNWDAEDGAYYV